MNLLEVEALSSGYKTIPILHEVSLHVQEGEFVGVVGLNGMGKSTLLRTLAGELPATSGHIRLGGAEVTCLPVHGRARLGMGFVPQGRRIFPNLTVRENLLVSALGMGRAPETVEKVLASFPRLRPILERKGGVLSGGEQQILALARCLCGEPRLILLDEPTEGIQPSIRDEIVETLHRIRTRSAITLLLVEQNVHFIRSLCTRLYEIEKGEIL